MRAGQRKTGGSLVLFFHRNTVKTGRCATEGEKAGDSRVAVDNCSDTGVTDRQRSARYDLAAPFIVAALIP